MSLGDPRTRMLSGRVKSTKIDGDKVSFEIESEPFQNDPEYAPKFYDALGRLIVLWGLFEHHLETNLRILISVAKRYGINEEMQFSFDRKAKSFVGLYRDIPPLSHQLNDARELMKNAAEVAQRRNRFIHSIVNDWGDEADPHIFFRCYYWEKKQLRGMDIRATLTDIEDVYKAADGLNTGLMNLTGPLHQLARDGKL
jgi:hypothetical protein